MSTHPADRPADPPGPRGLSAGQGETRRTELPRYKLILLSEAGRDMMFVVRTIMELTRFCQAEATHKMWEAHHYGRSLLLVTYRERAELYVEQFTGRGLKVALEQA